MPEPTPKSIPEEPTPAETTRQTLEATPAPTTVQPMPELTPKPRPESKAAETIPQTPEPTLAPTTLQPMSEPTPSGTTRHTTEAMLAPRTLQPTPATPKLMPKTTPAQSIVCGSVSFCVGWEGSNVYCYGKDDACMWDS